MKQNILFLLLCSLATQVWAQPNSQPSFVSPEVFSDGKVIFRLWAPKANEVKLNAQFENIQAYSWKQGTELTTLADQVANLDQWIYYYCTTKA